jgi:hypothetical protein
MHRARQQMLQFDVVQIVACTRHTHGFQLSQRTFTYPPLHTCTTCLLYLQQSATEIESPCACVPIPAQPTTASDIVVRVERYSEDRSQVTVSICRKSGGAGCTARATTAYQTTRKSGLWAS